MTMDPGETLDYLVVDRYLRDFLGAQVLAYAFDCGLIDSLANQSDPDLDMDARGSEFLYGVLHRDAVVEQVSGSLQLTDEFKKALKYKDLLEAKLRFSSLLTSDVVERLPKLVVNPDEFFAESSLFSLFDYSRALEVNDENLSLARRWVSLTTALTRYEGQALLQAYSFEAATQWLDVGGNSGEFALQLVQAYPGITVSILDLPVVCELGREHLAAAEQADRIRFIAADALAGLPGGNDVVSFKSMLHDWPEPAVEILLDHAFEALNPGGQLLIFERATLDWPSTQATFGNLCTQLFFRSYKSSDFYERRLKESGFVNIECQSISLETRFHVITASKPA